MDAIETTTVEQDGHRYRITVYADQDAANPLEDWDEMGTILSLNRRHATFDPGGIEGAMGRDPDAVPLSYFEHGLCRWSVAGELPAGCRCPFDSAGFAGCWLPDDATRESARNYGGRTRQLFMRQRARQACEAYTLWCNGEVYGYEIGRVCSCDACGAEKPEPVDSCWGFYGMDACLAEARDALAARAGVPLDDLRAPVTIHLNYGEKP
jgi:hypothetical protein